MVNIGDVNQDDSSHQLKVLELCSDLVFKAESRGLKKEKCVVFRQLANNSDVCQMSADDHEKKLRLSE